MLNIIEAGADQTVEASVENPLDAGPTEDKREWVTLQNPGFDAKQEIRGSSIELPELIQGGGLQQKAVAEQFANASGSLQ